MLTRKGWRNGHEIGFGIGIAHGFATLGTIGFEGRFDYAAIGTVSNVASRLCDQAKPGQILISPRVSMAVEKDITVETGRRFCAPGDALRPPTQNNVVATKTGRLRPADKNGCFMSAIGIKRTWVGALQMSAFDPKRTFRCI